MDSWGRSRLTRLALLASLLTATVVTVSAGVAPAATPVVSIPAAIVDHVEGSSGLSTATLTAVLDQPSASTITVTYATVDGTAKVADSDYVAGSGTLTFAPGVTTQPINVSVRGDTKLEDYELLTVKLSAPMNATLGHATEQVQIDNDEKPKLSMAVVKVAEGQPAVFKPKLLQRYFQPITLTAQTADGTAVAPADYAALSGPITFPAGNKGPLSVSVATVADGITESAETFSLQASGTGVVAAVTRTATIGSQLCAGSPAPAHYSHVVLVVMENRQYAQVIGNAAAPWLTALAKGCATAKAYAQAASPSRPNYMAMTAGSTFDCAGSNSDPAANSCHPTSPSLFKQVIDAGGTAISYAEGMTGNCDSSSHNSYAVKHNAWPYFAAEASLCAQFDQPLPASIDVNNLPTLLEIAPNLCHDMHDCSTATGDAWLAQYLQPVLDSARYRSGDTAVIVTFDEYTNVPNAFAAQSVKAATTVTTATSHYGLLRTVEDMLGLAPLGQAATATSLRTAMRL